MAEEDAVASARKDGVDLLSLLDRGFRGSHLLVLGDIILDRRVYTDRLAERKYKQPGVDVLEYQNVGGQNDLIRAGGAGTIARAAATYFATVDLCGVIGRDDEGAMLVKGLDKEKDVTFHPIYAEDRDTTVFTSFLVRVGRTDYEERLRVDRESKAPLPKSVIKTMVETVRSLVRKKKPDAVVIADFGLGVATKATVERIGAWLNKRRIPIIIDPGTGDWATWEAPLAAVFPTSKEAWDALRLKDPGVWEALGGDDYPPEWASFEDCGAFVRALMEACPNVQRLCINDPYGALLAIARDDDLHGLYRYHLIDPPRSYGVQSLSGSESVPTAVAALALSTTKDSNVYWDDFFRTAYAAKCLSHINMSIRVEQIAGWNDVRAVLRGPQSSAWTWPELPQKDSARIQQSERELSLQRAIKQLRKTIHLKDAKTAVPGIFAVSRFLQRQLNDAVKGLNDLSRQLKKKSLPKPARLWVHGPTRIGKDFIVEKLVKEVVGRPMKTLGPAEYSSSKFNAAREFKTAHRIGRVLVADELDKRQGRMVNDAFLIPLQDPTLGGVLFVAVTSLEDVEDVLLKDLLKRLDPKEEALALRLDLPPLDHRFEDVPYLFVACLSNSAGNSALPSKVSKRALEILLRRDLTMQVICDAAARLVKSCRGGTIDSKAMAKALQIEYKDVHTMFYPNDEDTVDIDSRI